MQAVNVSLLSGIPDPRLGTLIETRYPVRSFRRSDYGS